LKLRRQYIWFYFQVKLFAVGVIYVLSTEADSLFMENQNNSHRTYKDLLQNRGQYLQLPNMVGTVIEYLSYGLKVPVIGPLLQHSFTIVCCALGRLRRKRDYHGLYDLLIGCLSHSVFKHKGYRWWYLMRFAVAIAQERQINWLVRDIVLEDNLILLGSLGPRPLTGYDVAYSFVGYSLWLFERGDILGAINMIKIAEQADETWGYPEYLHGWYGLFTRGVDSVEHFTRAVHIDWSFLQRMKQDRTCRDHPDVLHEVQKRTLVAK
jgi:hypothetical protein